MSIYELYSFLDILFHLKIKLYLLIIIYIINYKLNRIKF